MSAKTSLEMAAIEKRRRDDSEEEREARKAQEAQDALANRAFKYLQDCQAQSSRPQALHIPGSSWKGHQDYTDAKCIIYQHRPFHRVWKFIVSCLVLYTVLVLPVTIAFPPPGIAYIAFDVVVDAFFIVDLILNFFTAPILADGTLCVDHKRIAVNYLKGWFVFDCFASVPFDAIALALAQRDNKQAAIPRLFRGLRLVRAFKLWGSTAFTEYSERIRTKFGIQTSVMRIISLGLGVLLFVHTMGCLWFFIGDSNDPESWLYYTKFNQPNIDGYIVSVYYTVVTFASVGYGDITPKSTGEMVFSAILIISGTSTFAFITGSLASIIQSANERSRTYRLKMVSLLSFLNAIDPPQGLRQHLVDKYTLAWQDETSHDSYDWQDIITDPVSKQEVIETMYSDLFEKSEFFIKYHKYRAFLAQLMLEVEPMILMAGQMVAFKSEPVKSWYVVSSGALYALRDDLELRKFRFRQDNETGHFRLTIPEKLLANLGIDSPRRGQQEAGGSTRSQDSAAIVILGPEEEGGRGGVGGNSVPAAAEGGPGSSSATSSSSGSDGPLVGQPTSSSKRQAKLGVRNSSALASRRRSSPILRLHLPQEAVVLGSELLVQLEYMRADVWKQGDWAGIWETTEVGSKAFKEMVVISEDIVDRGAVSFRTRKLMSGKQYEVRYQRSRGFGDPARQVLAVSPPFSPVLMRPNTNFLQFDPGATLGEVELFSVGQWPYSVVTASECHLFRLPMEKFLHLLEDFESERSYGLTKQMHEHAKTNLAKLKESEFIDQNLRPFPWTTGEQLRNDLYKAIIGVEPERDDALSEGRLSFAGGGHGGLSRRVSAAPHQSPVPSPMPSAALGGLVPPLAPGGGSSGSSGSSSSSGSNGENGGSGGGTRVYPLPLEDDGVPALERLGSVGTPAAIPSALGAVTAQTNRTLATNHHELMAAIASLQRELLELKSAHLRTKA